MDSILVFAFFAPLVLLIWALVRHASRIRQEALDKDLRSQHLENLSPAIVRFVLERDRHTCQQCGATHQVGVDFTGETPEEGHEITAGDLEACCANCHLKRWKTLRNTPAGERNRILPRLW